MAFLNPRNIAACLMSKYERGLGQNGHFSFLDNIQRLCARLAAAGAPLVFMMVLVLVLELESGAGSDRDSRSRSRPPSAIDRDSRSK